MISIDEVVTQGSKFIGLFAKKLKDITPTQVQLYLFVAEHEGLSMAEIQQQTKLSRGTLSRNLKKLGTTVEGSKEDPTVKVKIGYGLVEPQLSLENRREYSMRLTPKGRNLLKEYLTES